MTRFYLRVVVFMTVVFMTSIVVWINLGTQIEERFFKPRILMQLDELADVLKDRLAGLSPGEAAAELKKLEPLLNFQAELVDPATRSDAGSATGTSSDNMQPRVYVPLGNEDSLLLILRPSKERSPIFAQQEGRFLFLGLFFTVCIIGVGGFVLIRPLVKKLKQQEETIGKIADGNLNARVSVRSGDALGRLGQRINLMADRIQELLAHQRQLLEAVSHEMRTPSARIGFSLEMLADATSDEERQRRIASLNEDVADLDELLDDLLTFLRFDERDRKLTVENIDLSDILARLKERVERFRPGLPIHLNQASGPVTTTANPKYFPRVLENLLMNAMRYAKARVDVQWGQRDGEAFVEIADDGPGIPAADRERIFQPFTRLDESRGRHSGGKGLGLAIAARVMERHHGSITVDESESGGARFTVTLPQIP